MTAPATDSYHYAPLQHSQPAASASLVQQLRLNRLSPLTFVLALVTAFVLFYALTPYLSFARAPSSLQPLVARHSQLSDAATAHPSAALSKRVHLSAQLLPNLQQFAVATFAPHSSTERHVHPTLSEVFHVKQGKARFVFDAGREEAVGVDDTVAIPPGAWHTVVNEGDVELRMVYASILV